MVIIIMYFHMQNTPHFDLIVGNPSKGGYLRSKCFLAVMQLYEYRHGKKFKNTTHKIGHECMGSQTLFECMGTAK